MLDVSTSFKTLCDGMSYFYFLETSLVIFNFSLDLKIVFRLSIFLCQTKKSINYNKLRSPTYFYSAVVLERAAHIFVWCVRSQTVISKVVLIP